MSLIRVHNVEISERQVEVGQRAFALVRGETTVTMGSETSGLVATYRRPARIQSDLDRPASPIHDYVMWARVLALVVLVLSLIWRLTDERT